MKEKSFKPKETKKIQTSEKYKITRKQNKRKKTQKKENP